MKKDDLEQRKEMINSFAGVFNEALYEIYGENTKALLIAKWNALCDMYLSE